MKDNYFHEDFPTFEEFAKTTNTVYYRRVTSDVLEGSLCGKANFTTKKAIWASCEDGVQIYYADSLAYRREFRYLRSLLFTPDDDIELGSIHRCGDYIFTTDGDIISDNIPFCGLS